MFPKLKISSLVLKRFEKVQQQCSGCLFGLMYDGNLLVLGFNIETTIGQFNYKQIQYKFPAELDLCGLVKFGTDGVTEANISKVIQDVDITDNPILLQCELGTLVDLKASLFMHGKLQQISYEVISEEELYADFCFARVQCGFNFLTEEDSDRVAKNMQRLRKNFACGSPIFRIKNTNINLTGTSTGCSSKSDIAEVLSAISASTNPQKSKKHSKLQTPTEYEMIIIDVLKQKTKETSEAKLKAARMITKSCENFIRVPLAVDVLAMLYKPTMLAGLYDILVESVCRSLRLIEHTLAERVREGHTLPVVRIDHFLVPELGHFLSCVYPEGISEDDDYMKQKRKKLHHHFDIPLTRPYFRKGSRYIAKEDLPAGVLTNTHVGVKASNVKDGKQYLVQGKYSYYHYMQQNFNDNGWGCAYRSLQTLCSWFRWQGYTERDVPTHDEIQKYLVEIGDKDRNFIGSKQWIGSTEVSMCLSGLLGVDSKILHVSSGSELASKGYDLLMHFESQGTPIMVGGGTLAHTILGIDFNSTTGELKFLILDPHYTGEDDLGIIQSKGWCGWKGIDFWSKNSYYNLCMPQRPIMF
uniref:Probable Ufm1-specific protease 2 n=1 Tax=Tabanus bromius TaxID=304241 RepID=A0A0K8TSP7_TABBR